MIYFVVHYLFTSFQTHNANKLNYMYTCDAVIFIQKVYGLPQFNNFKATHPTCERKTNELHFLLRFETINLNNIRCLRIGQNIK